MQAAETGDKRKARRFSMAFLLLCPILLLTVVFFLLDSIIIYRLAIMQLRRASIDNVSTTVNQTISFFGVPPFRHPDRVLSA